MAVLKRAFILFSMTGLLCLTCSVTNAYVEFKVSKVAASECSAALITMESELNRWMSHFNATYPNNVKMQECIYWIENGGDGGSCTSGSSEWKTIKKETKFVSKAMSVCNTCDCPRQSVMIEWMYKGGFPYFKKYMLDRQNPGDNTAEETDDTEEENRTVDDSLDSIPAIS